MTRNFSRRRLFIAGAAAAFVAPRIALAQSYPSRPVHLVVGFSPGSASDINARLVAQWLSERLGQQFVVDNRPGAASNIAAEFVVRSAPDGYTLFYPTPPNAINATLYADKLNYNFLRDIAPVASIVRTPVVMEVNMSLPAKSVPEFIAYAKGNPGKINMATVGPGSAQHLYGELFMMMTGTTLVPVHYHGATPAITDLLAGQVQVMFDVVVSSLSYIKAGQVCALAVTTAERQDVLPDIPTVAEFVQGYEASGWQGIGAPTGTPEAIVNTLNKEINGALTDPVFKERLAALGGIPFTSTPEGFGEFLAAETEKWGKVALAANIKPE